MQKVTRSLRVRIKGILPSVAEDRAVLIWCLIGAAIVWLFSRLSHEVTVSRQFVIEYRVQKGLTFTNPPATALHVSVKATGWSHLYDMLLSNVAVLTLDVDSVGRGVYSKETLLPIVQTFVNNNCKVTDIHPSSLDFNVEPEVERILPLKMVLIRTFDQGVFATAAPKLVPSHVRVRGPASRMSQLSSWSLDTIFNHASNTAETSVKLNLPIKKGTMMLVDTSAIMLEAPAELFTQKKIFVEVNPINMAGKVEIFPRRVTISFLVALSSYSQVTAADFGVEADFINIQANASETNLLLRVVKKPSFVKNVKCTPDNVSFVFKK